MEISWGSMEILMGFNVKKSSGWRGTKELWLSIYNCFNMGASWSYYPLVI